MSEEHEGSSVVRMQVQHGDVVTLEHPNGDRIGPRTVEAVKQGAGVTSLLVTKVGDFDPSSAQAVHGRYLGTLLRAGWVVTTVNGEPSDS